MLSIGGRYRSCAVRIDLPTDAATRADAAEQLAKLVDSVWPEHVLTLGYGPTDHVTPMLTRLHDALTEHGQHPEMMLRVSDGRYFADPPCPDPACCPPEGHPVDLALSPVAAEAILAGHVAYPSRADLAATLDPVGGPTRRRMIAETARAEQRLLPGPGDDAPPAPELTEALYPDAIALIEDLYAACTPHGEPATERQMAELGVLLTLTRIRDEAWVRMDPDHLPRYLPLWTRVLRHVQPDYQAAPACLLAYAAYASGDGTMANLALERAAQADPAYPMTDLIAAVIAAGVPPEATRLRMSPDQLNHLWTRPSAGPAPDTDRHT
ncbi:DUF4192 domain-containing protein [Actinomadura rupiterrae]|uniref:DUF4192 domain-containing protein n=1 Tax=Actinomadura rupiterrae TaxID=559627 RepID=UPI0020A4239A|nr:DUF4192 domain-containing protein [Actinomadura rupiterrae]MCP2341149.1 hypothetical protein [Actinomadura rupiterrae]